MNEVIETIKKIGEEFLSLAKQMEQESLTPEEKSKTLAPEGKKETISKTEPLPMEKEKAGIKLEDVRAVLAEISRNGKTAEMKALLSRFGVSRLSDLDPAHYGDILTEAEVIKNA